MINIENYYENTLIDSIEDMEPKKIGYKMVPIYIIPVKILDNEEDWDYAWIKDGKGRGHAAVF